MSIKFRMYQDNRKNSKRKGYWYARAVSPDVVSVKDLALRISERCTVTEPDILAVSQCVGVRDESGPQGW